jgi:hypothetical protein
MVRGDLTPFQARRTHRLRSQKRGVREQKRLSSDLGRLPDRVLGRVRNVADETKPVQCANCVGAERGEAVVRHRAGLEVPDIVRRVMHKLGVTDAAFVGFLEAFELHLQEVESFDIHHDRGPGLVRRVQIGGRECSAQSMVRHHLIHPGKALEMVFVELSRLRRA